MLIKTGIISNLVPNSKSSKILKRSFHDTSIKKYELACLFVKDWEKYFLKQNSFLEFFAFINITARRTSNLNSFHTAPADPKKPLKFRGV